MHFGRMLTYRSRARDVARATQTDRLAERLLTAARAIAAQAFVNRDDTAHALSSVGLTMHWSDRTEIGVVAARDPGLATLRARLAVAMLDAGRHDIRLGYVDGRSEGGAHGIIGSLRLTDGSFVSFSVALSGEPGPVLHAELLSTTLMAGGVALVAILLMRSVGAPLRGLAKAADAIGAGPHVTVPEADPEEARQVARAFTGCLGRSSLCSRSCRACPTTITMTYGWRCRFRANAAAVTWLCAACRWAAQVLISPQQPPCQVSTSAVRNNAMSSLASLPTGRPASYPIGRRIFVQGTTSLGLAAGFARLIRPARALAPAGSPMPMLQGDRFDLSIGKMKVNFTGRAATAIAVNGSVPAPILRWRQGETVTLNVKNTLDEPTSIHWHGIRSRATMDGVPGLSFAGIAPGETFTYRIPLHQSGTYWYHSHSGFQEQVGLYGSIIVDPKGGYAQKFDRDYVVVLSDWTDTEPNEVVSNLKFQNDYYNFHQRDAGTFLADARKNGLGNTLKDRATWGNMRMSATDIADVTGATYTYLLNGHAPNANWTGLFRRGERVRLRFINAGSMTFFDVRIPGLKMTVVQADGNDLEPVEVDEFRVGSAETYDVIVTPTAAAYTIFAQSQDRTGFARGTLATSAGMAAAIPPMDPRPVRTMADMGMAGMGGMDISDAGKPAGKPLKDDGMNGMDMSGGGSMAGMDMGGASKPDDAPKPDLRGAVAVDNVAMSPTDRLGDPGDGLDPSKRRVLTYKDLRATRPGADPRPPSRDITLHLTGNMMRYIWGFDGRKFSQAEPIRLALGERVRFNLINDTMMEHPIHLHGLWSELENGQDEYRPYKHTVIVQPGGKLSYLVTADEPGMWAFHCHLLYHMEMGMMRTVLVA